jgi:hypothetical protein
MVIHLEVTFAACQVGLVLFCSHGRGEVWDEPVRLIGEGDTTALDRGARTSSAPCGACLM